MKKIFSVLIIFLLAFTLISCDDIGGDNNGNNTTKFNTDVYYLNDTHGAIFNKGSELGMARIANYIKEDRDSNSVFITGGDILQGQLISNSNRGAIFMEVFNEMELDAFVVGNHEFDWGIDEILKYFNDEENDVKANFPLLGANVIDNRTGKIPVGMDTHTIIERDGHLIGIIGVIGDGLESSIAYHRVSNYQFTNAYNAVEKIATGIAPLVDFILVVNHADDSRFNERVAKINKVAAIFNGHSHQEKIGLVVNNDNKYIPWIQSRHNGHMVGKISLTFDVNSKNKLTYVSGVAENIKNHTYLNSSDPNVENIINNYYTELANVYTEVLLVSEAEYKQNDLAHYIARLMKEVSGAVAGFQNSGGTRATISNNQQITGADIFQIFPFDNVIIVSEVKGSVLKILLNDSYFFTNSSINQASINDDLYYKVATNDYVFYSTYNTHTFGSAINVVEIGDMYEVFYQVMLNLKAEGYTTFNTDLPILFN